MTEDDARDWIRAGWGEPTLNRLHEFVELLRGENQRQNLVSPASLDEVWVRHIMDSAQLVRFMAGANAGTWLDIGSGAGFPGLVIAVLSPATHVVLVDPRRKRCEWLESVKSSFDLGNCDIRLGRIEQIESFPAATISARAVANLEVLVGWGTRFSTHATTWLLPKGRGGAQELNEADVRLRKMFHVEQSQTDKDAVILVGQGVPGSSR